LKIDVAPLVPKLRKNRTFHTNYIRHTQEEAATLREIIESERLLNLLNTSLDYAFTKPVKRKFWQPTRKMFTTIGHRWKPTRRTFSLVGNVCPLTRIATTTIVPPRKPIPIASNTDKPVITLLYSRKSKVAKKVPVSNSTINKSLVANKMKPNNSWGSSSSNVPSSLIECRLFTLFSGIWTPAAQSIRPEIALSSSTMYRNFLARLNSKMIMWRTRRIVKTIHVDFDELTEMASKQSSSGSALHEMTLATISSGLVQKSSSSTPFLPRSRNVWDLLFQPMFDELLNPPPSVDHQAA
nr:hypothetical protein [Tanacetum cinerariifolium]